ncbi:MAG TPA: hypothetical protein VEG27_12025 [Usitatibacter sp.]|nr:hypothetical protein [Usitatibacter sp.]
MTGSMRRHVSVGLAALAAACAIAPPDSRETAAQAAERRAQAPRPAYNLAGYPPAAREGYIDGCESARGSAYAHRDAKRMADDPQYAMGWNDGYSMCRRQ